MLNVVISETQAVVSISDIVNGIARGYQENASVSAETIAKALEEVAVAKVIHKKHAYLSDISYSVTELLALEQLFKTEYETKWSPAGGLRVYF